MSPADTARPSRSRFRSPTAARAARRSRRASEEPQTELIEPGKALVLTDFQPPALSAGEKLMRLAYRMGVSGPTLTAPFRKPAKPRLLATVESPLGGDRVAGVALRAGHFLIHGVKAPIAQMDFAPAARLTPPFERMVHGFEWLRDLSACAPREQCTPTAERILGAWLDANPKAGKGAAWSVGNAGHRLLNWLVHAPLILSGSDKACAPGRSPPRTTPRAGSTAASTRAEDGLAETAGWCAIVAAGLLLPDGKPRRLFGEAGLVQGAGRTGRRRWRGAVAQPARRRWKRSGCWSISRPATARPGAIRPKRSMRC